MSDLNHLFENNRAWSDKMMRDNEGFFEKLSKQQKPDYLWIGCSDSRVPANELIGLLPGEVFVHRNVANMVIHTDFNCLSVIQYAVEVLRVKHVIVCGHYGCGGVREAMQNSAHGFIDNWLRHLRDIYETHQGPLTAIADTDNRFDRLCELNVIEQVRNVCRTSVVRQAWRSGQELTVHGWIYDIGNGLLKDLEISMDTFEMVKDTSKEAVRRTFS